MSNHNNNNNEITSSNIDSENKNYINNSYLDNYINNNNNIENNNSINIHDNENSNSNVLKEHDNNLNRIDDDGINNYNNSNDINNNIENKNNSHEEIKNNHINNEQSELRRSSRLNNKDEVGKYKEIKITSSFKNSKDVKALKSNIMNDEKIRKKNMCNQLSIGNYDSIINTELSKNVKMSRKDVRCTVRGLMAMNNKGVESFMNHATEVHEILYSEKNKKGGQT